jgi:hypothetical protein
MTDLPFTLDRRYTVSNLRAQVERLTGERDTALAATQASAAAAQGLLAANRRAVEWLRTVDASRMSGQQVVDDLLRELAVTPEATS